MVRADLFNLSLFMQYLPKTAVAVLALLLMNGFLTYLVVFQGAEYIYRENGWVENLQVLLLVVASMIFALSSRQQKGVHRTICYFFSLLCFVFMFREVDFERIDGMPSFIVFMLAEQGRTVFFLGLLVLLVLMLKEIKFFWAHKAQYFQLPMVWSIIIAALMLIIFSHIFDRKIWMIEHRVFYEELSEMTSYYFILIASLFSFQELQNVWKTVHSGNE